jgi:regulator of sigma E protease
VVVEEFGFGYPPRLLKLWQDAGRAVIGYWQVVIPRNFPLASALSVGQAVDVLAEDMNGMLVLKQATVVPNPGPGFSEVRLSTDGGIRLLGIIREWTVGTEYTINALPLGGFVRMRGEEDPNLSGSFASKSALARTAILAAGPVMNLLLTPILLIGTVMLSPTIVPLGNVRITNVAANSPAAMASIRAGDAIVEVDGQRVARAEEVSNQIRLHVGEEITLTIRRGDQVLPVRLLARKNPPSGQGPTGVTLTQDRGVKVFAVAPQSIAAQAGLRAGDALRVEKPKEGTRLGERPEIISNSDDLAAYFRQWAGMSLKIPIGRDGELVYVTLQIPKDLPKEQATLGISLRPVSIGQIFAEVGQRLVDIVAQTAQFVRLLVQGTAPGSPIIGPVGIVQLTGEVIETGPANLIVLAALLSLNLGIVNLLPIPGLDGGRLFFILIEGLRGGKRVAPATEALIHLIGLGFLILLLIVVSYFDITRIIRGEPLIPK